MAARGGVAGRHERMKIRVPPRPVKLSSFMVTP
jgi:hypothetical protein